MIKKVLIIFSVLIYSLPCFAQNTSSLNEDWQEKFFKSEAVTLPLVIDAALKNSIQLLKLDAAKEAAGEQLKLAKKEILSGVGINSGYNYGTMLNLIGSDLQAVNSLNPFVLPARPTYTVGLNMNLGLAQIITRRHNIKQQEIAIKQVGFDADLQKRQIRAETINLYKQLILARTIMQHSQDALQSANVNKAIAEKRFKDGELQVDEQIAAIGNYNQALLSFEESKNKYETTLLMMEELIGMSVKDLMTL